MDTVLGGLEGSGSTFIDALLNKRAMRLPGSTNSLKHQDESTPTTHKSPIRPQTRTLLLPLIGT